jgi:hypothetical protein
MRHVPLEGQVRIHPAVDQRIGPWSALVAVETDAGCSATAVLPSAIEIASHAAASASSSRWERVVSGVRIGRGRVWCAARAARIVDVISADQ